MNHRDTKRLINSLILRRYNDAMRIKRLKRRLNDLNLFFLTGGAGRRMGKILQLLKNKGLISVGAAGVGAGAYSLKNRNGRKVISELEKQNLSKSEIAKIMALLEDNDDE